MGRDRLVIRGSPRRPGGVRQDIPPAQPGRGRILRHQGEVRRGSARKDACSAEAAARTQMHLLQPRRLDPSTRKAGHGSRGCCAQTAGCDTKSESFPYRLLRPEGIPASLHAQTPQNVHESGAEAPNWAAPPCVTHLKSRFLGAAVPESPAPCRPRPPACACPSVGSQRCAVSWTASCPSPRSLCRACMPRKCRA